MQGHAPRATLQLNVKYVCFKRRAGHDPALYIYRIFFSSLLVIINKKLKYNFIKNKY